MTIFKITAHSYCNPFIPHVILTVLFLVKFLNILIQEQAEVSNIQLAWEILELARIIFERYAT